MWAKRRKSRTCAMATRSKKRQRNPFEYSSRYLGSANRPKRNWYGVKQVYAWKRNGKIDCFEERVFLVKAESEDELDVILEKEEKEYCDCRDPDRSIERITDMYEIYYIMDAEHTDNPLEVFSHLYRRKRSITKF